MPTVNPDGNAAGSRTNGNGVDLNRNFSTNWQPVDCAARPRNCAGPAPLSEPETRLVATLVESIQPRLTVVYHGADHLASAAMAVVASPTAVEAYAATAGYAIGSVACSPSCTGTSTQFVNATVSGATAFAVELSTKAAGGMSPQGVVRHAGRGLRRSRERLAPAYPSPSPGADRRSVLTPSSPRWPRARPIR